MESSSFAEIDGLLDELLSPEYVARRRAIEKIKDLPTSSIRIVGALVAVHETDENLMLRKLADEALQNPAHKAMFEQGEKEDLIREIARYSQARKQSVEHPTRGRFEPASLHAGSQSKTSRAKWLIAGGCGAILLLALVLAGGGFLTLYGGGGEGANAGTAEKVLREFFEAINADDIESAHQMFIEETRSQLSPEQMAADLKANTDLAALISQYQSLQVCEWGFVLQNNIRYMTPRGLIHYGNGDVVFVAELRQDPDTIWRIALFQLTDTEPKPWGACR